MTSILHAAACYRTAVHSAQGTYGITYAATHRATGEAAAVKVIAKRRLVSPEEVDDVRRELAALRRLRGQPNVVQLKVRKCRRGVCYSLCSRVKCGPPGQLNVVQLQAGNHLAMCWDTRKCVNSYSLPPHSPACVRQGVYEDKQRVCIVMELCGGGELFGSIVRRGALSERDAAGLMRHVVGAVAQMHGQGIMHRWGGRGAWGGGRGGGEAGKEVGGGRCSGCKGVCGHTGRA